MANERTTAAGAAFARRVYGPRALGCALSFLFVATVVYPGSTGLWSLMLVNGFAWPLLAYHTAIRCSSPYKAELRNMQLDFLFAGAWVVVMQFSPLPSALLVSMVAMNSVAAKGLRFLLRGVLAGLLGALAAALLIGVRVESSMPAQVIWACMPMLIIYPLVVGWTCYRLARQLVAQKRAFSIVTSLDEQPMIEPDRWLYVLGQEFQRCRCGTGNATLACIRIDDLPALRERYGELVVEALSIRLGHLIQRSMRSSDLLSRQATDQFWVLFLQTRAFGAQAFTERIEEGFRQLCGGATGIPQAQIRVGLVEFSQQLISEHQWQKQAYAQACEPSLTDPHEGEAGCTRAAT